jgi:hypothetical protein
MNFKLHKTEYIKDLAQSHAVAYRCNATKQLGIAVFNDSQIGLVDYTDKNRVIIFRKNKKMWLCCVTCNNNVIAYNIFDKKDIQQKQTNNELVKFITQNSINVNINDLKFEHQQLTQKHRELSQKHAWEIWESIRNKDGITTINVNELCIEKLDANGDEIWEW